MKSMIERVEVRECPLTGGKQAMCDRSDNECLYCDCYDEDFGCTMPSIDKWYACPLEMGEEEFRAIIASNDRPENSPLMSLNQAKTDRVRNYPQYRELYDRYKQWKGIPRWYPLSDSERLEFERYVLGEVKGVKNDERT